MRAAHALVIMMAAATSTALAQDPRAAAVLMVEDGGYPGSDTTERMGLALYGRFLSAGRYARVLTVQGRDRANERLSQAIRAAAAGHDVVDVFCSVHTTTREPAEWTRLIPPEARKLRFVYSTACYGAEEERRAWERVGARTVVTHVGINNPVVALPMILSRWLGGGEVGPAVAAGYRETAMTMGFMLSLPGAVGAAGIPDVAGSRPVIMGDPRLRRPGVALPDGLSYDRARGGPLGLALRALEGFRVGRGELQPLLDRISLPLVLPAGALEQVQGVSVERSWGGEGQLALGLARQVDVPWQGVTLRAGERVTMRPGRADPATRTVEVHTTGLWVKKGIFRVKLSKLTLSPDAAGGYRVRANAALWGFIPFFKSFSIGGRAPQPLAAAEPIYLAPGSSTGLARVVSR